MALKGRKRGMEWTRFISPEELEDQVLLFYVSFLLA